MTYSLTRPLSPALAAPYELTSLNREAQPESHLSSSNASFVSEKHTLPTNRSAEQRIRNQFSQSSLGNAMRANAEHRINTDSSLEDVASNSDLLFAYLSKLFEPHINDQNRDQFKELIGSRVQRLIAKGETVESVSDVLSKGNYLDIIAQATVGLVRAVPFGIASKVLDEIPAITAAAKTPASSGAIVGVFSGAADTFGGSLLRTATSDTQWLSAKSDDLEGVMQEAQKAVEPTLKKLVVELGLAFQAFTGRNTLRIMVGSLVAHMEDGVKAAKVDSWLSAVGGVGAGMIAHSILHTFNKKNHRIGAEYLLARTDWETQFDMLRNTTWKTPIQNAGMRVLPMSVSDLKGMMKAPFSAAKELFTPSSLVNNGVVLTAGFAGVVSGKAAVSEAAKAAGFSDAKVEVLKQSVNTLISAPIFAAWTTGDVIIPPLTNKAMNALSAQSRTTSDKTPGPTMPDDIEANNPNT